MTAQNSADPSGVSGTGNKTTIARARKADAAVQLRIAGASWSEIATTLGYPTPRQALVSTERALQRQLQEGDSREQMRRMAGARLDRLLRSVWAKAVNPADPEHLLAVTKAREIVDRQAKLYGLDAPTEVIVHNPTATEIEAWVAKVVSVGAPPVPEYDIITGQVLSVTDEVGTKAGEQ